MNTAHLPYRAGYATEQPASSLQSPYVRIIQFVTLLTLFRSGLFVWYF